MGMDGRLYALGRYKKGLEKVLQMDPRDDSPEGSPVMQQVAWCSGSNMTRALMDALGRSNFKLTDMYFSPEYMLSRYGELLVFETEYRNCFQQLDAIETLATAGFHFYFDPDG
jgi:hypothetical protein